MQSLFLKSLVLMGVIGGGCFAVWRAHETLQNNSPQTDPQSFTALDSSDLSEEDTGGLGHDENAETLDLGIANSSSGSDAGQTPAFSGSETASELEPTPAKKPWNFQPTLAEEKENSTEKTANVFPADFVAGSNAKPLVEGSEKEASKTLKTTPTMPSSYFSASGNEIPKIEIPSGPSQILKVVADEPEESEQGTILQAGYETAPGGNNESEGKLFLPDRLGAESSAVLPAEIPAELGNRFGPRTGQDTESAPGLMRLPPSHPGPVLLPPSALPTLGQLTERNTENPEPPSEEPENPFSKFTVQPLNDELTLPITNNEPVLPEVPTSNPFEKFEARPIQTVDMKPASPGDVGFNPTPPLPSIPKVEEDPFAANPDERVLPSAAIGSLAEQPVPSELLPPTETDVLPTGGIELPTPALRPAPMAGAFPLSPGNEERDTPKMVEPEPFLPSPPEASASTGTADDAPVLPKILPSSGNTLPQIRPSTNQPFPSTESRTTNGTGLPIISPGRSLEKQPISERPNPNFSAKSSEVLPTPAPIVNQGVPNSFPPQTPTEEGRVNPISKEVEAEPESVLPFGFETEPAPKLAEPTPAATSTNPDLPPKAMPASVLPFGFETEPAPTIAEPTPAATSTIPDLTPEPISSIPPSVGIGLPSTLQIAEPAVEELRTAEATKAAKEFPTNPTIDPAVAPGPQSPELKIEKIAPPQASIGEPLIYSIRIRNVGGSEARKVVVEDRIPRGTELSGTIPQAAMTEDKLIWELGNINSGDERIIKLKVIPMEAGEIGSVATVSFESVISATIQVIAPKLSVNIDGPTETLLGENVPYKFTVRNTGDGDAKDVVLRAILPPSLKHPNGDDIEADLGTIPAGQEKTVNLVVVANEVGVATPKALIWMNGKNYAENRADLRVLESRIRLSRTGSKRSFVGRSGKFVTQVTNDSSTPLSNVKIEEHVPVSLDLAEFVNGWNPQQRVIEHLIPLLQPGENRNFTTQLIPNRAGEIVSKLIAHDLSGNRVEVAATLSVKGFADLEADVSRKNKDVAIGDQVSLRLKLKNSGTAPATNVRAAFEIPPELVFSTASGPSNYEVVGNQVIFDEVSEMSSNSEKNYDIVLIAAEEGNTRVKIDFISADYSEPIRREEPVRVLPDQE